MQYILLNYDLTSNRYAVEAWAADELMTARRVVHTGTLESCLDYIRRAETR